MVGGVLVTWGFGGGIALLVLNHPPGCLVMPDFGGSAGLERAEMSGEGGAAYEGGSVLGGGMVRGCVGDLGFCWQNCPPGTESPSRYRITLPVRNDPPGTKSPSRCGNILGGGCCWCLGDLCWLNRSPGTK